MAYTVNKTDGTVVATITDGTVNNTTSLSLLGRNYQSYGEIIAENFIKLLENSASTSAPSAPITGELWYDKTINNLKVYNGSNFVHINSVRSQSSVPTTGLQNGVFWYDTVNALLKMYVAGTGFVSMGPFTIQDDDSFASATASALASSESIKAYVDNTIVALNALPIYDDASNSQSVNITDGILFRGGNSITSSVNLDSSNTEYSVTMALDSDIYVNSIQSSDSTKVRINDVLEVNSLTSNGAIAGAGNITTSSGNITTSSGNISASGSGTFGSIVISNNTITSSDSSVISFGGEQLSGIADPTQATDAATKSYVDSQVSSFSGNSITQGNSNVTVTDSGTGAVTTDVDGGTVITTNATNTTIDQPLLVTSDSGITVGADQDVTLTQSGANFTLKNTTEDGNILINVNDGGVDTTAITINGADYSVAIAGGLTVTGNLTVSGTTTTVNSTNTTVADPLIVLNKGQTFTSAYDSGIIIDRGVGDSTNQKNAGMIWDESANEFAFIYTTENGATAGNVSITQYADIQYSNATGVSSGAYYADLAENYLSDSNYEPGTVVVFGGDKEITLANTDSDPRVAGVISTAPAYLMNIQLEQGQPVALQGRVPCKVIGPIRKGDRMVSSSTPGHAVAYNSDNMKYEPGCIIGKALENYDSAESGIIEIVVGKN